MDDFLPGLLLGFGTCLFFLVMPMLIVGTDANTAYTKGVTDCRSGKVSYTVTVTPEGVDTAYTYKP